MSYRETPEVSKAVVRLTAAIGKRIAGDGIPEYLQELVSIETQVKESFRVAVAGLRADGHSDEEIGRALGTSRQAVWQRWPRAAGEEPAAAGGGQPVP